MLFSHSSFFSRNQNARKSGNKCTEIFQRKWGTIWPRDHPFKTSACLRGGGVKNLPNLPTDSTKKTVDGRGVGVKNL